MKSLEDLVSPATESRINTETQRRDNLLLLWPEYPAETNIVTEQMYPLSLVCKL